MLGSSQHEWHSPNAQTFEGFDNVEIIDACWRAGNLTWKLDEHQVEVYDLFEEWNARRQQPDYGEFVKAIDAKYESVWMEEIGRRFGKTAKWIIKLTEMVIQLHALTGEYVMLTYATAAQKSIGGIIVPMANSLLRDGPDDMRPEYHGTRGALHEGLYFPNDMGVIKLVGIDEHPNALRGQHSDGIVISEAAFVTRLANTVKSILLPQFQRRPHAFLALESSTAVQPDHDFNSEFREDCKLRGAYVMRTIDDNKAIDAREKEKALREAGGRGDPVCDREYYCEETRDAEMLIVPEFQKKLHVHDHQQPRYMRAYVTADPGSRDLFALIFGYWDFLAARAVIQDSWARRNASTRQMACVIALKEWQLWGRWPSPKLADIPLCEDKSLPEEARITGWVELLRGDATYEQCLELWTMAKVAAPGIDSPRPPLKWTMPLDPSNPRSCYWNGKEFRQNPCSRRSDVALQFVQDLSSEYGMLFDTTAKDDAEAQLHNLRDAVGSGKFVFLPGCGPVITHLDNAVWNKKRTDWERTPGIGHADLIACLIYFWRNVQREANANPPDFVGRDPHETMMGSVAGQKTITPAARALERAFGGTSGMRARGQRRAQQSSRRNW